MTRYVLGFMFSPCLSTVVLIKKNKPEWQRGKFNGVGGQINDNEEDVDAMVREYLEETGVTTIAEEWTRFCSMRGNKFAVECFCGIGAVELVETMTEEQVVLASSHNSAVNIKDLAWLMPIAMEHLSNGKRLFVTAHYP